MYTKIFLSALKVKKKGITYFDSKFFLVFFNYFMNYYLKPQNSIHFKLIFKMYKVCGFTLINRQFRNYATNIIYMLFKLDLYHFTDYNELNEYLQGKFDIPAFQCRIIKKSSVYSLFSSTLSF